MESYRQTPFCLTHTLYTLVLDCLHFVCVHGASVCLHPPSPHPLWRWGRGADGEGGRAHPPPTRHFSLVRQVSGAQTRDITGRALQAYPPGATELRRWAFKGQQNRRWGGWAPQGQQMGWGGSFYSWDACSSCLELILIIQKGKNKNL